MWVEFFLVGFDVGFLDEFTSESALVTYIALLKVVLTKSLY